MIGVTRKPFSVPATEKVGAGLICTCTQVGAATMVYAISTWEAWSRFHSENILDGV